MKLDLDIDKLAGPGRPPAQISYEVVRPINEADLEALATIPAQSVPDPIKRISERHHQLARLLAAGVPPGEAAIITNYDPSRVSVLRNSPAFKNLEALYKKEKAAEFTSLTEVIAGLSRDAMHELMNRLEENPEKFSHKDLADIIKGFMPYAQADGPNLTKLPTLIELVAPDKELPDDRNED